ncbi:MAG TPA: ribosome biogenesis GTPase Der [Myxococcota bacterium]|nr:ribosome biogenesis GTPase Der [Myxococcota bacterium]
MSTAKPIIAIIGRPNVGKSTLFNRILGRRAAIVDDFPGVTRDRQYGEAEHCGREFIVEDTGGFEPGSEDGMLVLMAAQVETAIAEADALVFVVDGRQGLLPIDQVIWHQIRRSGMTVFVAVNKIDTPAADSLVSDFYGLGATELYPMTAEGGSGVAELLDALVETIPMPTVASDDGEASADDEMSGPCRITLLGRPNVGKSTLANALLGKERFLTSDVPGTTRDAIDTVFHSNGREYVLVDTAGIRRRRAVERGVERMSVARTIRAIENCHVVVLLIDSSEGVTDQDKKLASLVIDRGRGLVIVVNKWDLKTGGNAAGDFKLHMQDEMAFTSFAPVVFTSALTGKNVGKLLPVVDHVHAGLFSRIGTSELNRFFSEVIERHPPASHGAKTVRIKFITQVQVNPPTILLFCSGTGRIDTSYFRYLQRELYSRYDFEGVPIRLVQR